MSHPANDIFNEEMYEQGRICQYDGCENNMTDLVRAYCEWKNKTVDLFDGHYFCLEHQEQYLKEYEEQKKK